MVESRCWIPSLDAEYSMFPAGSYKSCRIQNDPPGGRMAATKSEWQHSKFETNSKSQGFDSQTISLWIDANLGLAETGRLGLANIAGPNADWIFYRDPVKACRQVSRPLSLLMPACRIHVVWLEQYGYFSPFLYRWPPKIPFMAPHLRRCSLPKGITCRLYHLNKAGSIANGIDTRHERLTPELRNLPVSAPGFYPLHIEIIR